MIFLNFVNIVLPRFLETQKLDFVDLNDLIIVDGNFHRPMIQRFNVLPDDLQPVRVSLICLKSTHLDISVYRNPTAGQAHSTLGKMSVV
jgi:hypothetical protein